MNVYSVNINPLLNMIKRYQLDRERVFTIVLDFLSHRREEILNAQLSKWFSPYDARIKEIMKPILYQLISELNHSDNVEAFYIKNSYFYFKDSGYDEDAFGDGGW